MNDSCENDGDENCTTNIKIEYHDPTDTGRVVSQILTYPPRRSTSAKMTPIVEKTSSPILIKREPSFSFNPPEVVLLNGCWNTVNRIPSLVDMHTVETENFAQFPQTYKCNNTPSYDASDVSPSPRGSDSGIESDCTDGNLSWLLNYKIQELPPVPDTCPGHMSCPGPIANTESTNNTSQQVVNAFPCSQPVQQATFIVPDNDLRSMTSRYVSGPRKPPFTYTELIEHALCEKGELTVSGIYQWISEHFPFYKHNDDRWKNSVRHNLSINPHFRKGGKAVHGAGHLWTIAQRDGSKSWKMRQRIEEFIQTSGVRNKNKSTTDSSESAQSPEQDAFDRELQAATESILEEIESSQKEQEVQITSKGNEIHVEYINVPDGADTLEGFLSPPVSKQQLVDECGLGTDDFFITDINPNALGLNLVGPEAVAEDVIYEEMSFDYLKD